MIRVIGVRFRTAGKIYFFDPLEFDINKNDHVIVETARGIEFGTVVSGITEVDDEKVVQPLKPVLRIANERDREQEATNKEKEKEAFKICLEKIQEHGLEMKLIDAEYTFDNNKVLFYFTADGRIDFRELVKDLASVFKTRIELRQIGVRDETKIVGGIGICGRPLCCHSYLSDFVPVSIKMAKEQNLSLNPAKISGVCGRLMCCLKNEEETYEELNRRLPNIGDYVTTGDGLKGEVQSVNVLRQLVKVIVNVGDEKEIKEYAVEQLQFRHKRSKKEKMELTKEELEELERLEKEELESRGAEAAAAQHQDNRGRHDRRKFQDGRQDNRQRENDQSFDGGETGSQRQGGKYRQNRNHQDGKDAHKDRDHNNEQNDLGGNDNANTEGMQGDREDANADKSLYGVEVSAESSFLSKEYANTESVPDSGRHMKGSEYEDDRNPIEENETQDHRTHGRGNEHQDHRTHGRGNQHQDDRNHTRGNESQDDKKHAKGNERQDHRSYTKGNEFQDNRNHTKGNERQDNRSYVNGNGRQDGRYHQNGNYHRRQEQYGYQGGRNRHENRNRYHARGRREGQSGRNDNQTESE